MPNLLGQAGRIWRATDGAVRAEVALALTVCLVVASLAGLAAIVWFAGVRQTDTMFEPGVAQGAFAAATRRAGPGLEVLAIEITPREMAVRGFDRNPPPAAKPAFGARPAPTADAPGLAEASWRVTRQSFFGRLDRYTVTGPTPESDAPRDHGNSFRLQPADIPDLPQLAHKAKQRAGLDGNSSIVSVAINAKQVIVRLNSSKGISESAFDREELAPPKPHQDALPPPPTGPTAAVKPPAPPAPPIAAVPPALPAPPVVSAAPPAPAAPKPDAPEIAAAGQQVAASAARIKADDARARQDYAEAVRWDRAAAELGVAEAQFNLGIDYDKGEGVPQDFGLAFHWFQLAADQGLPEAENLVGVAYAAGQGVPQDYAAAMRWYRKAADQDNDAAALHLGTLYATGKGTQQNYVQAMHWYRKAADQGVVAAQYDVGLLYFNGLGVPVDRRQGRRWIEKAAEGGDEPAQHWLDTH